MTLIKLPSGHFVNLDQVVTIHIRNGNVFVATSGCPFTLQGDDAKVILEWADRAANRPTLTILEAIARGGELSAGSEDFQEAVRQAVLDERDACKQIAVQLALSKPDIKEKDVAATIVMKIKERGVV